MAYLKILMLLLSSMDPGRQELIIPRKNSVGAYFGFFEGNINYERNMYVFSKSYINVRTGWGQWNNLQSEADVYNLTAVWIIGKKLSHLELNAGAKYLAGPGKNRVYPDMFLGYRLEKPDSRLYGRAGVSGLSVVNIGAGIKF
ncbi:MAG TPA: hypothetical protein VK213_01545 [Bacteroidales bacterium]|nr:hypothetical protein [Bacteroidales bacterium]